MAYCTAEEVIDMLKPDMYGYIVGDIVKNPDEQEQGSWMDTELPSQQKLRELMLPLAADAADDAQAEIDGYLAKRYDVPFVHVPPVISKFAKDIALYNLVSRKGIDESDREKTYLTRYNAAVAFLTKVAEGKVDIDTGESHTTQMAAANGFSVKSEHRIFSRSSMRGW